LKRLFLPSVLFGPLRHFTSDLPWYRLRCSVPRTAHLSPPSYRYDLHALRVARCMDPGSRRDASQLSVARGYPTVHMQGQWAWGTRSPSIRFFFILLIK